MSTVAVFNKILGTMLLFTLAFLSCQPILISENAAGARVERGPPLNTKLIIAILCLPKYASSVRSSQD